MFPRYPHFTYELEALKSNAAGVEATCAVGSGV